MEATLCDISASFGPGSVGICRRTAGCRPGAGRADANADPDFDANLDSYPYADSAAYADVNRYADPAAYVDAAAYVDVHGYACASPGYIDTRVGPAHAIAHAHRDAALANRHSNADAHLVGHADLRR